MSESSITIAMLIKELDYISGGIRRRVEMANEFQRRGYKVTIYLEKLIRKELWKETGILPPITNGWPSYLEEDLVFIGDTRTKQPEVKGKPLFFLNAIWLKPASIPRQRKYLTNRDCIKIAFTREIYDWFRRVYQKQDVILAEGGINLGFFKPLKRRRENNVLTFYHKNGIEVEKALRKLAKKNIELKLEKIEGKMDKELLEAYNRTKVVVSAQRGKTEIIKRVWNNVVAEAMACKAPTVVERDDVIKDLCFHKCTSYICDSFEDLAEGIEFYLDNPVKTERIVRNAYRCIQEYSWKRLIDKLEIGLIRKGVM